MEKRYIKVISLFLVFILLSVSCSNGTKETEMGIQENNAEEVVGNDENLPKENPESEKVDVEVTEAEEEIEIIEPTESEVELFNQLAGGFFYTKDSGDDYSEMRKESIDLFIDQMITVLEDGYDFYTGGIKSYEDKLLLFIGNIDASRTEYNDDFQYIINRMMGYKTQLNTLAAQSNGYFEKIENYANDDVSKAVIYSDIFETTVKFYEKLDAYLLFLESTSEYLATGIIEDFNKDYALTLRQHTAEVFEQEILPDIIEVIKAYDQMALTYTLINSGDYYYTKSISEDIIAQLESLEDVEGIVEIKDEFIEEMNNPSSYILTIQNEEETSFRIPFIKIAYAEEYNIAEYDNFLEVYKFIHKLSINPNITEKELDEALMSLVLQKHNVHIEEKKAEIEETKKEDPELLRPETILFFGTERLIQLADTDKSYSLKNKEGLSHVIGEEVEASKIQQAVKKEVINQEKREKMIEKLKSIQNSGESFAGSFLMSLSADIGGKVVYDKVIKSFTDVLVENKDKMGQETFEQLENILENDLEEILGSKKTDFANKFLNGSAEEIVNSFTDWVNESSNRKDLKINKNTLISVLDAMGFEHEGELEEIINAMTSDEEGIDDTEKPANESNEAFDLEDKDAVLLNYLSYMLPLMDGIDQEDLKNTADELNISKEEMYVYAMSTLVIGTKNTVGGDDELSADEKRAKEGLANFLDGGKEIDPWVRDYCISLFYDLFNEKSDLDRWRNLTDEEKRELVNDALNDDSNDEESQGTDERELAESSDEEIEASESNGEAINTNDNNAFVFHRQDNGNVNAEHTFSPYSDEYMRRDTTTYHKDGALESTGSILIKKEAADLMIENYTTVIERQKNAKPGDFIPKPLAPARANYFKIGLHERFEEAGKILSSIEYDNEGNILLSKAWQYYDDGSLKEYREMDGDNTGSITHYDSEKYGGGKKYTDVFENNKSVNRINYD